MPDLARFTNAELEQMADRAYARVMQATDYLMLPASADDIALPVHRAAFTEAAELHMACVLELSRRFAAAAGCCPVCGTPPGHACWTGALGPIEDGRHVSA